MKYLEVKLFRFIIFLLKRGYGAECETSDLDDFREEYFKEQSGSNMFEIITHDSRCVACKAKETIDFLEHHIELRKM